MIYCVRKNESSIQVRVYDVHAILWVWSWGRTLFSTGTREEELTDIGKRTTPEVPPSYREVESALNSIMIKSYSSYSDRTKGNVFDIQVSDDHLKVWLYYASFLGSPDEAYL